MIKVENITKKFDKISAVDDISFEIAKGEIVGLLGPNGAGKTTTLRIISGYLAPTSGKVFINNIDMFVNPLGAKSHLGYMPENVPLYTDLEVREYLTFFAKILRAPKDKLKTHLDKIIEKTGLLSVQKQLIGTLSKGFRQRVGLAQALLGGPDVLILDEPTIGLDPIQIMEIRKLIKDLAKDQTVILSSHILSEVSATCSRIIIINEGKIIADGKPDDLAKLVRGAKIILAKIRGNPKEIQAKINQFNQGNSVEIYSSLKNDLAIYKISTNNLVDEEQIAKLVIESGWGLQELKPEYLELENIFIKLTSKDEKNNLLSKLGSQK